MEGAPSIKKRKLHTTFRIQKLSTVLSFCTQDTQIRWHHSSRGMKGKKEKRGIHKKEKREHRKGKDNKKRFKLKKK